MPSATTEETLDPFIVMEMVDNLNAPSVREDNVGVTRSRAGSTGRQGTLSRPPPPQNEKDSTLLYHK